MAFFSRKYRRAVFAALLMHAITVPAQTSLPQLPADARIERGVLGCGAAYYMVNDPVRKGYAQIALVRKGEAPSADGVAALQTDFLGRMGVVPGPDGYLAEKDGSSVYRFGDVRFYRPEVLDSVLLYTFNCMAASTAPQAVIVSGDIDAEELKKKMEIFSMLVSRLSDVEEDAPYEWTANPAPRVELFREGAASVEAAYAGARIPRSYMNTAQALVTDLFGRELGLLLEHRLQIAFREADIPVGGIGFCSRGSDDAAGDEEYAVRVKVAPEQIDAATEVLARTLAALGASGPGVEEYADSKQVLLPVVSRRASELPPAEDYVERCIAHFLYGANLAPYTESLRFFARKKVSDSTETRLFADYASALLTQLENLRLRCGPVQESDSTDVSGDLLFRYNLHYLLGHFSADGKDYSWHSADTAGFDFSPAKLKIKSEKTEAVSGGTLWTLSNGMRVIYKQVKGSGMFSYALQLNGGLSQIGSLKEGEGGYIGELLFTDDAAGLPAPVFRDVLAANGISMRCDVQLNSMAITGDAPSDKLSLVLKALLNLANNRSPDPACFDYYRRCQQLAGPDDEFLFRLNPSYKYTVCRKPSALSAETQKKAWKYYEDRFARVSDGVLILSGDLSPEGARRHLLNYLGGFRVMRGGVARKAVEMRTLNGTATVSETGAPEVRVLLDAEYPFTAGNFYLSQIAQQALRLSLVRALAGRGYVFDTECSYAVSPQERFRISIRCTPAAEGAGESPEQVLSAVRAAIREAAVTPVAPEDLAAWKVLVRSGVAASLESPEGFVTTLLARYAANKDVLSGYEAAISALSARQVSDFLQTLAKGGRIEAVRHE